MDNARFDYLRTIEDKLNGLIIQSANKKGVSSFDQTFLINVGNIVNALFLYEETSRLSDKWIPMEEK